MGRQVGCIDSYRRVRREVKPRVRSEKTLLDDIVKKQKSGISSLRDAGGTDTSVFLSTIRGKLEEFLQTLNENEDTTIILRQMRSNIKYYLRTSPCININTEVMSPTWGAAAMDLYTKVKERQVSPTSTSEPFRTMLTLRSRKRCKRS
jgi:hypothetical protein